MTYMFTLVGQGIGDSHYLNDWKNVQKNINVSK